MGFTEMLVLGVIALLVIGPKQLPEVARVVGRTLNELKRATGDFTSTLYGVKNDADKYRQQAHDYMYEQKKNFEKILEESLQEEPPVEISSNEESNGELPPHKPDGDGDQSS